MKSEISEFEKSEKTGTKEGLAELALMHKNYGMKYTDADANNYLYAAGQYYFYENNLNEAKPILTEYISRDDSTERYRNASMNLAIAHSQSGDYEKVDNLISDLLEDKLPTAAQWQDIVKLYEEKIASDKLLKTDDYERLAMAYTATGRFSKAISSLDTAIADFPKYEKRANLIYRAGFIGWEYLNNTEVAKKYYNQFLEEYPNDPKAAEVKQILSSGMLEMTDEAILEMLKGKGK
jgi:tetratricopeptide (TPR) repeat protein